MLSFFCGGILRFFVVCSRGGAFHCDGALSRFFVLCSFSGYVFFLGFHDSLDRFEGGPFVVCMISRFAVRCRLFGVISTAFVVRFGGLLFFHFYFFGCTLPLLVPVSVEGFHDFKVLLFVRFGLFFFPVLCFFVVSVLVVDFHVFSIHFWWRFFL